MRADVWFEPAKVVEVAGAQLTISPVHTVARGLIKRGALALTRSIVLRRALLASTRLKISSTSGNSGISRAVHCAGDILIFNNLRMHRRVDMGQGCLSAICLISHR